MLVRKHALSELQPIIATNTALYHTKKELAITITSGDFHLKPLMVKCRQRAVWQTGAATDVWRALMRLPACEPRGHLTWLGWLHPELAIQVWDRVFCAD